MPCIVSLGEPMIEFTGVSEGRLNEVGTFERGWGGDTSNFIVGVARLGGEGSYVTRVGDDDFGLSLLKLWEREGVDSSGVIIEKGGRTGIYFVSRWSEGGHSFTYYRADSPASRFKIDDLEEGCLDSSSHFHTSGITLGISNSMREAAFFMLKAAKNRGVIVTFDPNIRPRLWRDQETALEAIRKALRYSDVVYATVEEAEDLAGRSGTEAAAETLRKIGAEIVVIKKASEGCEVYTSEQCFKREAFRVNVVDTTGAGDVFSAGFTVGLAKDWCPSDCAIFANAVAALKIMGRGAVKPIPSYSRVERFLLEKGFRLPTRNV